MRWFWNLVCNSILYWSVHNTHYKETMFGGPFKVLCTAYYCMLHKALKNTLHTHILQFRLQRVKKVAEELSGEVTRIPFPCLHFHDFELLLFSQLLLRYLYLAHLCLMNWSCIQNSHPVPIKPGILALPESWAHSCCVDVLYVVC